MNTLWPFVVLSVFTKFVVCRDFYLGMFKRNDFLVAQDVIYKAPSPFGYTTASYGRLFKCPITYFRVVDRLGMGRGPFTTIVRGGLKKKFISIRIKSTYRLPVSVNIYVGCENKQPSTFRSARVTLTTVTSKLASTIPNIKASSASTAETPDPIANSKNDTNKDSDKKDGGSENRNIDSTETTDGGGPTTGDTESTTVETTTYDNTGSQANQTG